MPREDTQFKKGQNNYPNRNPGGRPKKPEWLKGKGEEALKVVYSIMTDEDTKVADKLAAAKMIAEYDLGKPQQAVEVDAKNIPQVIFVGGDKVAD